MAAVPEVVGRLRRWPWALRLATAGGAALVVIAIVVAATARGSQDALRSPGQPRTAPTFSLPDLEDASRRVELTAYRGRPVVLNFWASWCVPCRQDMPHLEAVHRAEGERVVFLGINHQDGRSPARDLLAQTGVTYPSGHDPEGKVASAYRLVGMPSTVFISSSGEILATRAGEMSRSQLEDAMRTLFVSRGAG